MTAPEGVDDVLHVEARAGAERTPEGLWKDSEGEQNLAPLVDWPPAEILERWAARRSKQIRRRRGRRRFLALLLVAGLTASAVFALTRTTSTGPSGPAAGASVSFGSIAVSLDLGFQHMVAVVAVPKGIPPSVVAIPAAAEVDIIGGAPITVSEAAATPGLMVAAAQAALDRRVDHYVALDSNGLANLVDALGGVDVQTEAAFTFGTQVIGPGPARLTGGAAVAYLLQSTVEDVTGRWEEVLSGVFSAKAGAKAWGSLTGLSDAIAQVRLVLAHAEGAAVLELPTAPTVDGGIAVDGEASADLVRAHFGTGPGGLVRVVVLNGNGRESVGQEIALLLAPAGFRVVAAQDAQSFSVTQTEIVAAGDVFEGDAERVQALLGVGMVYVDAQPTGIADITIKVGKDFTSG